MANATLSLSVSDTSDQSLLQLSINLKIKKYRLAHYEQNCLIIYENYS